MVPMCMGVPNVERVLYKQLFPGDFKKFEGQSNADPSAGGGARDIRFGHYADIEPIVKTMFPVAVPQSRKRGAGHVKVDIQQGQVLWHGAPTTITAAFEPAQDERPTEWRLAQVASIPFLANATPKGTMTDPDMIVLVQDNTKRVWIVHEPRSVVIADPTLGPLVSTAVANHVYSNHAVLGYADFMSGKVWSY